MILMGLVLDVWAVYRGTILIKSCGRVLTFFLFSELSQTFPCTSFETFCQIYSHVFNIFDATEKKHWIFN